MNILKIAFLGSVLVVSGAAVASYAAPEGNGNFSSASYAAPEGNGNFSTLLCRPGRQWQFQHCFLRGPGRQWPYRRCVMKTRSQGSRPGVPCRIS